MLRMTTIKSWHFVKPIPNFYILLIILLLFLHDGSIVETRRLTQGDSMNERKFAAEAKEKNLVFPVEETLYNSPDPDYYLGDGPGPENGLKYNISKKSHRKRKDKGKDRLQKKAREIYEGFLLLRPKTTTDVDDSLFDALPDVDGSVLEPETTLRPSTTIKSSTTQKYRTTSTTPKTKCFNCKKKDVIKITLDEGKEDDYVNNTGTRTRPQVQTKRGIFLGRTIKVNNTEVLAFLGIPYAAPPTKNLRFKAPFPPHFKPPDTFIDASEIKQPCFPTKPDRTSSSYVQTKQQDSHNSNKTLEANEDCLYLNIWVPQNATIDKNLVPVLVWIHGEGFLSGMNTEDYESIVGFVEKIKVIVVSIQYRLGVFGFLYVGTPDAPGNMGLLDQIQALQWIDENIEPFGGNPNAITLMGHDMGAAFVGFHLISKISPSFFKRAIMIGGAPTQPHVFRDNHTVYNATSEFSKELECKTHSDKALIECLLSVDSTTVWNIQTLFHSNTYNALSFPFVPTNDGFVLEDTPQKLLERRKGKMGRILVGAAANSGSVIILKSIDGILKDKPTFFSYDKFLRVMTHIFRKFSQVEVDFILHHYKNWNNLEDGYANQMKIVDAISDFYFICPLRKFSDLWSARGLGTNFFLFSQRSSALNRSEWMRAVHGDELDFLFGIPLRFPHAFTEAERKLSEVLLEVMEHFVKLGIIANGWERYGRETPTYANFKADQLPPRNYFGPRAKECAFWNELFAELS